MSQQRFEEQDFNTQHLNRSLWGQLLRNLFKQKRNLFRLGTAIIIISLADAMWPLFTQQAIDQFILGSGTDDQLIRFSVIFMLVLVVQSITLYFYIAISGKVEMDYAYDIRQQAMTKLQELPFAYFDKTPSGWIMARMTSDISRLSEIISWGMMDTVYGFVMMFWILISMFLADWRLSLIVIALVPLLYMISSWFQKHILMAYRRVRKVNSQITAGFSEGIAGAKTTKTLVLEESNFNEFHELTQEMRMRSIKAARLNAVYMPIIMSISSLTIAMILYVGGHQVLMKTIQFGTLMLFVQYTQQFFEPLRNLSRILAEMQMAQASAERVISLINEQPGMVDRPDVIDRYGSLLHPKTEAYEPIRGDIQFDHVDFSYIPEEPVLKDFNLSVQAGQTIALVGATGSGKSTIVNLLCRFYEPTDGMLKIDGIDVRERSIGWLHSKIGYVLQSPHLFSGTVRENIRFGKLDATDEEIVNAAKLVDAHAFIMQLEQGYDTEVGEAGGRLSTGQKQLISFARAVLANPAIFVLDEATSSIDTETEQIIQRAIEELMKDRTSFIVAHRLSTIVNADRILVIDKGRIIEDGNHEALMRLKGRYWQLYTNQFQEDLQSRLYEAMSQQV